ncbi:PH domain-containing protein [Streptomyces sp. NBC_00503]|uniref:PH domain-containing protein n=1 Tax=Streptomyces sp. NBC_00503 TaxID=2903659 RepID=UPI002E8095D2|nr:PH domain-containing protein [Streptomyces sp. NBC_00503]WUD83242.1 PH domain-containing protein [Streptomyces sp. NBC_00503]
MSSEQPTDEPVYDDRVYRSPMATVTGVAMLALLAWLCGDTVVRGSGNAPWIAVAVALCLAPLIVAFTIRPAVFANADRMRVRNPFRTIELPWGAVDTVRARFSAEVVAEGSRYQLWSIPVSLRERKRVNRIQNGRPSRLGGLMGRSMTAPGDGAKPPVDAAPRASADQNVDELRELHERGASRAGAQGTVKVAWSYEILVPAVIGLLLLIVLLATG